MTATEITTIKSKIASVLITNAGIAPTRTATLLPMKSLQGKLYEADVLATICENLVRHEGVTITLAGGSHLMLKQKGGAIDRNYPYFQVWNGRTLFCEIFTDVYFDTLSYHIKGSPLPKVNGDYHELDIALLKPNLTGHPKHSDILLAIECKNTSIKKSIIRELLGFRRELSLYHKPSIPTNFKNWPITLINADPNSVHMLYCSDYRINRYSTNCAEFGILLQHHRMR
jgi:hypothetical protein